MLFENEEKSCVPEEGEQYATFSLNFTQPGAHLFEIPCNPPFLFRNKVFTSAALLALHGLARSQLLLPHASEILAVLEGATCVPARAA